MRYATDEEIEKFLISKSGATFSQQHDEEIRPYFNRFLEFYRQDLRNNRAKIAASARWKKEKAKNTLGDKKKPKKKA